MKRNYLPLSWIIGMGCLAAACNDAEDSCAGRPSVFAGSLDTTGTDADEELEQLRCAEVVTGDLTVSETTSLKALSSLVHVQGNLRIRMTDQVQSVAGLENLQRVDGDFSLRDHADLSSLEALASLIVVGGSFELQGLPKVSKLTGLEALREVGGDFTLRDNAALVDLASLTSLRRVQGRLTIADAPALRDIGLQRPSLGGLEIAGADSLQELDLQFNFVADASCGKIGDETVVIRSNALLREVRLSEDSGFGCVGIYYNPELVALSCNLHIPRLERMRLWSLPKLEQVDCAHVQYSELEILETGLRTLAGFSGARVQCSMWVAHNPNLEDLGEFATSTGPIRDALEVHDNPKLAACQVEQMIESLPQGFALCPNNDRTITSRLVTVEKNDGEAMCGEAAPRPLRRSGAAHGHPFF